MKTKEISKIALNVALLAILSQITIPLHPIPFTLQMFGIYFISFMFSPKIAVVTSFLYLLLGFTGLPVFSQYKAGLLVFISPTIGFLLAFPFVSYFNAKMHDKLGLVLSFIFSSVILYTFGITGIQLIFKFVLKAPLSLSTSIHKYSLVFIPTDLFSYVLSYKLSEKLNNKYFSL